MTLRDYVRAFAALSSTLAAGVAGFAGNAVANCPEPVQAASVTGQPTQPQTQSQSPASAVHPANSSPAQPDIHLEMDTFEGTPEGTWNLKGAVTVKQGNRELRTKDAVYDPKTQTLTTRHEVEYSDPTMKVRGKAAEMAPAGGATFEGAQFELPARPARGSAERISATSDGNLSLDGVRYTSCPIGNDDWVFRASDIDIDQQAGMGTARRVRLDFKGVPILYTPFLTFPASAQRKTGLLYPVFGTSSRSGTQIGAPWYWNIAPEYDLTLLPTWYSRRGARLDSEFRYLSPLGHGVLSANYLPDDKAFGGSRNLVSFVDQSDFSSHLRLTTDAQQSSDTRWFEDFGLGPEGTSQSYLSRATSLTYLDDTWLATARLQNFQTMDTRIDRLDRPYTLLPQIGVHANLPNQAFGLTMRFDGEFSNFQRSDGVTGMRLDLAPEFRMPLRGAGVYLEPAASWRFTTYDLNDTAPGVDRRMSRSLPIFSLDAGLGFERNWGSHGQRLLTFEPRFMYLYVPYRNQDDLPVFDTTQADLNLVQLFRDNRYVGTDRISNANQVSIGVTSRLLDTGSGQQFISATVGQAFYFEQPRVTLPGMPLNDTNASDIVAELGLTAYRNWNVRMGVQWDPGDRRSEKGDVSIQYRPANDRVVNFGYRFRRDNLEQLDGSVAWPISDKWSAYGRMVYSLEDKATLDRFVGFEYRACCWRLRFVTRRYVSNREGTVDSSYMLQLELNGLASVGVSADAFLQRSIRGYSTDPTSP